MQRPSAEEWEDMGELGGHGGDWDQLSPSDQGSHAVGNRAGAMEGSLPLYATPLGCKGWFSRQHISSVTAVVTMQSPGCVAPAVLSTSAGQGIPCGAGTAGFYAKDKTASLEKIPSLLAPQGESMGAGPMAVLGHHAGWEP